jgi:hypothetical protein
MCNALWDPAAKGTRMKACKRTEGIARVRKSVGTASLDHRLGAARAVGDVYGHVGGHTNTYGVGEDGVGGAHGLRL